MESLWYFEPERPALQTIKPKSRPVCDMVNVYYGTDSGSFYSLNQRTGEIVWERRYNESVSASPLIYNGIIYIGSEDGFLTAVDAGTGTPIFRDMVADKVASTPEIAPQFGYVYLGLEWSTDDKKGSFACFDAVSGEKVWDFPTAEPAISRPLFAYNYGMLLCASDDGVVVSLDPLTGSANWLSPVFGEIKSQPVMDESNYAVIVTDFDGCITSLSIHTGEIIWSHKTQGYIYSDPLVHQGKIYVTSTDKFLYVLDAHNGGLHKKIYVGARMLATPKIYNNRLVFGDTSGILHVIDLENLQQIEGIKLPERICTAVDYNPFTDTYFVVTNDNVLFAVS